MGLREVLWIAAGGSLGALARYALGSAVQRSPFPWGTSVVNLVGCLLIGLLVGWSAARGDLGEGLRFFALIGFLGSFTTFSTFAFETLTLLRAGAPGAALGSLLLQVGGGLLAVVAGDRLGRLLA